MEPVKKKIKIAIPDKFIRPAIEIVKEFIGTGDIGKVFLTGNWENWGDSANPESVRAGCMRPTKEREMRLEGENWVIEVELVVGVYAFKPVVVTALADEKGMAPASWIVCPEEGVGEYICETTDVFHNWLVKVK